MDPNTLTILCDARLMAGVIIIVVLVQAAATAATILWMFRDGKETNYGH